MENLVQHKDNGGYLPSWTQINLIGRTQRNQHVGTQRKQHRGTQREQHEGTQREQPKGTQKEHPQPVFPLEVSPLANLRLVEMAVDGKPVITVERIEQIWCIQEPRKFLFWLKVP